MFNRWKNFRSAVAGWLTGSRGVELETVEPSEEITEDARLRDDTELKKREEKRRKKILNIVTELEKTEVNYVRRLELLVSLKRQATAILPEDVHKQIFQNIELIYKFHYENLLPDIQARLRTWENDPRIGDVMRKLVPFLKIYTEYVMSIEVAQALVETWKQKSSSFAGIIRDAESSQDYGKIKVQGHMLEPVQRIPRYKLLLTEYLKGLLENDPDRPDTEKAMQLVGEAAGHIEERMKQAEDKLVLVKLQRQFDFKIVNSTRRFIADVKLRQVKSTGKCPQRTLHLFSDMLLVSRPLMVSTVSRIISSPERYRVKHKITLADAVIEEGHNLQFPHTFYVRSKDITIELVAKDNEEKQKWQKAFSTQLSEVKKGSSSLEQCDGGEWNNAIFDQDGQACSSNNKDVLKSGAVQISDDGGRSFESRWLTVTNGLTVSCYLSANDTNPVSVVSLHAFNISVVDGSNVLHGLSRIRHSKRNKTILVLDDKVKKYYLRCKEGEATTKEWVAAFQQLKDEEPKDT